MAAPSVVGTPTTTAENSGATSLAVSVTMADGASGSRLFIAFAKDGDDLPSIETGHGTFTEHVRGSYTPGPDQVCFAVWSITYDDITGSPTTIDVTWTDSERAGAVAWWVDDDGVISVSSVTDTDGDTTPPNPALSGLTSADRLYMAVMGSDTGNSITSGPSGYTEIAYLVGGGGQGYKIGAASLEATASTGDTPGDWTYTGFGTATQTVLISMAEAVAAGVTLDAGAATETDSAGGADLVIPITFDAGGATETDIAGSGDLAVPVTLDAGGASETEAAGGADLLATITLDAGSASETDTASGADLNTNVTFDAGAATETDSAGGADLSILGLAVTLDAGAATETDSVGGADLVVLVTFDVGAATETDAAGGADFQPLITLDAGAATETSTASGGDLVVLVTFDAGGGTETELAGGADFVTPPVFDVGAAFESNTPGGVSFVIASGRLGTGYYVRIAQNGTYRLHLRPASTTMRRKGWQASEGWEVVSHTFQFDWGREDLVDGTLFGVDFQGDQATVTAAINAALITGGYAAV